MTISQAVALYSSLCNDPFPPTADAAPQIRTVADRAPEAEGQPALFFDRVAAPAPPQQAPTFRSRVPLARMCGEIADALAHFDDQRAERAIEEMMVFTAVEEVCCHILEPVLSEISQQRESGSLSAGAENFATAFILRKINVLFNLSRPHTGRGPIVAAGVEGDRREIGLLLTSLFLSRYGYHVIYMGPNLPVGDLIQTARSLKAPFVLLCANAECDIDTLNYTVTELADRFRRDADQREAPVIGYIGSIFVSRPELRRRVAAEFLGNDAFSAVGTVDRLLAAGRTI
jgi:methanogenic corrinoid protein MtbC1